MHPQPAAASTAFALDAPWKIHPQVALRPEAFGALAYHFGTRRLSFLKSPTLRGLVESLADHPNARAACEAAGVRDTELVAYAHALAQLAATDMIVAPAPS
jgi:putative mycofactocin binding protein MftB